MNFLHFEILTMYRIGTNLKPQKDKTMITPNQIIDHVETIPFNSYLNPRSILNRVNSDPKIQSPSKEIVDSLLKLRIPKSDNHDSLIEFLNQSVPGNDTGSLWELLLKGLKGISSYRQLDSMGWTQTDDGWESTFIFTGSPIDLISRIKKLPVFNFESHSFYFDSEQKFGFISSTGDKWFIKKSCEGYFKVFTHYLKVFQCHLDEGNKFYTNIIERQGHKTLTCCGDSLEEHWDNDLYFDLVPNLNFEDYLESFEQIKKLNSEDRLMIDSLPLIPDVKHGGFVDLTDLSKSIIELKEIVQNRLVSTEPTI